MTNNDKPKNAEQILEEIAQAVRLTTLATIINDLSDEHGRLKVQVHTEKAQRVPDVAKINHLEAAIGHAWQMVGALKSRKTALAIEFVNTLGGGLKAGPPSAVVIPKPGGMGRDNA